jgi:glycosyltransferase involved in cell wall biosynthesis
VSAVPSVSVVIPAYCEEATVAATIESARTGLSTLDPEALDILVVDDGSSDRTSECAAAAGAEVIRLPRNSGKGAALERGFTEAVGEIIVMLDADLGPSASEVTKLVLPIAEGRADMTVATFRKVAGHKGGFGLVMRLAHWGLRRSGGNPMSAPLSGQRAFTRATWARIGSLDPGFGIEMGLNLDAARAGLRVVEVETEMSHRLTGRDWAGFRHRARQLRDVARAILRRWRR